MNEAQAFQIPGYPRPFPVLLSMSWWQTGNPAVSGKAVQESTKGCAPVPLHRLAQSKQPHLEHWILSGTEDSRDSLASFYRTERHSLAVGNGESLWILEMEMEALPAVTLKLLLHKTSGPQELSFFLHPFMLQSEICEGPDKFQRLWNKWNVFKSLFAPIQVLLHLSRTMNLFHITGIFWWRVARHVVLHQLQPLSGRRSTKFAVSDSESNMPALCCLWQMAGVGWMLPTASQTITC